MGLCWKIHRDVIYHQINLLSSVLPFFQNLNNQYKNQRILMDLNTQNQLKCQQSSQLDMMALLQLTVNLSIQACNIIKDCHKNINVKKFQKAVDDHVTEADFKIQTMLIKEITKRFPNIKIVGEEQTQYKGDIKQVQLDKDKILLPEEFKIKNKYNIQDICLWIDPIDNTKGFIGDEIEGVTVLIGIAWKGVSEFGIVGIPYKKIDDKAVYKPSVIIGSSRDKLTFEYERQTKEWVRLKKPESHQKPVIVKKYSQTNQLQFQIIDNLDGQPIYMGGAGNKIIFTAKGFGDIMIYSEPRTYKWDSCGPSAIIKSLGGYFVDFDNKEIEYNQKAYPYRNEKGLLCGFVEKYRDVCIDTCKAFTSKK